MAVTSEVIPENTIPVLDHGFVRLDDVMASDLSVANAARVSFARRKEEMDESDAGLIRFLMRERHGTPFEHNAFRFHIRTPLFVAREWLRHRIGSFNEFSMRYAKATDEFYVPEPEDVRTQVGKPGAYSFEPVSTELAERTRDELQRVYAAAYAAYERLVERASRASSRARVMPVGAYTEFYWTVNARALMNFVSLRAAETAQREIRRYAEAVEGFLAEHMPVTHDAFVAAGASPRSISEDRPKEERDMAYELPPLPYPYEALEPHIDEQTMRIHHDKASPGLHRQGQTRRDISTGNPPHRAGARGRPRAAARGEAGSRPQQRRRACEPSLFWEIMGPDGGGDPSGDLGAAIEEPARSERRDDADSGSRRRFEERREAWDSTRHVRRRPRSRIQDSPLDWERSSWSAVATSWPTSTL